MTTRYPVYWLLLWLICVQGTALHAREADEGKWSIAFDGVSISEALRMLSSKTAVKIQATGNLEASVRKSYKDKSIDQIIKDLLRNKNYTMVWSYAQGGPSVDIRVFEKSRGNTAVGSAGGPGRRTAFPRVLQREVRPREVEQDRRVIEQESREVEQEPGEEMIGSKDSERPEDSEASNEQDYGTPPGTEGGEVGEPAKLEPDEPKKGAPTPTEENSAAPE